MNISGIILSGNMNEQIIYDDPMVHCAVYSVAYDNYYKSQVPWHWHEEIELLRVVRGSCMYRTAEEDTALGEGDAVFLAPGALHCLVPMAAGTLTHALLFTREFIFGKEGSTMQERYGVPLIERTGRSAVLIEHSCPVLLKMEEAEKLGTEKPYFYEPRLLSCLWDIWSVLLKKTSGREPVKPVARKEDERIKKMMLYIGEHYRDRISVADLSSAAGISERECYRLFVRDLQESPSAFVSAYRIQCSERLLLSGDLPVTSVAESCGFANSSHFARVFRERTGMTPREFRRKFSG